MSYPPENGGVSSAVLNGISFSVTAGSLVSLLGPTGCGKTTLIKILAGLLCPTKGEVDVDGVPVTGPSPDRTVIFQDYGLFEWMTVLENVEFGLKAKGFSKSDRREIAQRYVDLVHLRGAEFKYPAQLSGGMKQRAAIARALAVEPECVLMDEPFAACDSQTRLLLQEEILEIWEKTKKTIVLITHDVREAVFLADRVLVLSNVPAQIVLDQPVNLPRPRPIGSRSHPDFHRMVEHLWETLRSGGHKHTPLLFNTQQKGIK